MPSFEEVFAIAGRKAMPVFLVAVIFVSAMIVMLGTAAAAAQATVMTATAIESVQYIMLSAFGILTTLVMLVTKPKKGPPFGINSASVSAEATDSTLCVKNVLTNAA